MAVLGGFRWFWVVLGGFGVALRWSWVCWLLASLSADLPDGMFSVVASICL